MAQSYHHMSQNSLQHIYWECYENLKFRNLENITNLKLINLKNIRLAGYWVLNVMLNLQLQDSSYQKKFVQNTVFIQGTFVNSSVNLPIEVMSMHFKIFSNGDSFAVTYGTTCRTKRSYVLLHLSTYFQFLTRRCNMRFS